MKRYLKGEELFTHSHSVSEPCYCHKPSCYRSPRSLLEKKNTGLGIEEEEHPPLMS